MDAVCFDQPTISDWEQCPDDTEALPGQSAVLFELLLPSPDRYDIQGKYCENKSKSSHITLIFFHKSSGLVCFVLFIWDFISQYNDDTIHLTYHYWNFLMMSKFLISKFYLFVMIDIQGISKNLIDIILLSLYISCLLIDFHFLFSFYTRFLWNPKVRCTTCGTLQTEALLIGQKPRCSSL